MTRTSEKKPSSLKTAAGMLLVAAAVFACFFPTLNNEFVYDDLALIANNPHIRSLENVPKLFSGQYFGISGERTFRPVVTLSFFADAALWGAHPFGFRLTSILLHAAVCILLFLTSLRLTGNRLASLAGTLLFAVHPAPAEAVQGASFREDLLAAAFAGASLLLFIAWLDTGRSRLLPWAWLLYALGLFSKESAAALPLALLVMMLTDGKRRNRDARRVVFAASGFAAAAALFVAVFFGAFSGASRLGEYPGGSPVQTTAVMLAAFSKYLSILFVPSRLCLDHAPPAPAAADAASALALAGALIVLVAARRPAAPLSAGLLLFLTHLIPVSNVLPFGAVTANRYMYLPAAGLAIAAAGALALAAGKKNLSKYGAAAALYAAAFAAAALLSVKTAERNRVWENSETLWRDTSLCCPSSARAHTNYGLALLERDKPREAVSAFEKAVALDPHFNALNGLGAALTAAGELERAAAVYRRTVELHPDSAFAYHNGGLTFLKKGEYEEALRWFLKAAELAPGWHSPLYNAGNSYLKWGKPERAITIYLKALELDTTHTGTLGNLAVAYIQTGEVARARLYLERLLEIDPGNEAAKRHLESIGGRRGR
ncbi:MAG: tetratricopeptide repeat protein [bacterium]